MICIKHGRRILSYYFAVIIYGIIIQILFYFKVKPYFRIFNDTYITEF